MTDPVLTLDLPFAERLGHGKVREIYSLGDDLLLVATDRVSAFDVVMAEGIPGKGQVLTETTAFWLEHLADVVPHHLLSTDVRSWPEVPADYHELLDGRADEETRESKWQTEFDAAVANAQKTVEQQVTEAVDAAWHALEPV